jgi:hypothetical protein
MAKDIVEVWDQFINVLKLYCDAPSLLNPPCSTQNILEVEGKLDFELPYMLKTLLTLNNGQRIDREVVMKTSRWQKVANMIGYHAKEPSANKGNAQGIFKSISGWDVYDRHIYLGLEGIQTAYKTFIDDDVLVAEFGTNEIPFAVAGSAEKYREAFCINYVTGIVSLIWTLYYDPFNPPEWQIEKFIQAESLAEFIEKQITLYR